ncbi:hypothetical protein BCR44DRAFT_60218 [Catenaria anguillulae PL171]|uniref:Proteasome activator Blm10 mid region domain-containing protein n=1 Tax=Catenaria anguillulae PL171 TaxID=765915 RepID=A0A1Y2HKP9_9FUNG|nr:hypothetical protein BCR44DRAFT_60218 [Catenaria anguillulae PL171]
MQSEAQSTVPSQSNFPNNTTAQATHSIAPTITMPDDKTLYPADIATATDPFLHLIPLHNSDEDADDHVPTPMLTSLNSNARASPLNPFGNLGAPTDSDLTGASMDGLDDMDDPSVADEMGGGGHDGAHGGGDFGDGHGSGDEGDNAHDWDADADDDDEDGDDNENGNNDLGEDGQAMDVDSDTTQAEKDAKKRVPLGPPKPELPYPPSYALGGLPYIETAAQVRGEAARMLRGIKHGLASAIRRGDLSPGAVHWTRRLHSYLDVKYDLPLSDRVHFVQVYWDLIAGQVTVDEHEMNPDAKFMEPALVEVWAGMATRLLKKDQLLKPVAAQLTFHWRPVYNLIKNVYHRRSTSPRLSSTAMKSLASLGRLIEHSLAYAPESTAGEVFHEFFPRLGLVDLGQTVIATAMLNLFLPAQHVPVKHIKALVHAWIGQFVHVPTLDAMFIDVLTNIVALQPMETTRQWLTPGLARTLASRGLRMLELPVGSSDSGSAAGGTGAVKVELSASVVSILLKKRNFNRTRIFARWLVMTIEWDEGLDHLKTVIKASDSFTHPSNRGPWTGSLARFVRGVASEFAARLTETDPLPTPALRALTRPVVQLLRHPILYLAHARDANAANSAQGALRYLAAMDPQSIMPMLLAEYIYPSLGGVDPTLGADGAMDVSVAGGGDPGAQSHRLMAALAGMRSTVWALVHPTLWPAGPRDHLPELLYLVLPGIDVNDANKTLNTLLFIAQVHACVRLDKVLSHGADEWVVEFFNKVLALLENIDAAGPQAHQPGSGGGGKSKGPGGIEANMISALVYAVSNVVSQLTPDLFKVAANKMYTWARSRTLLHAGNAVAQLVHAVVARDPNGQLPKWLAWLDEVVRDEIEHGAGMSKTVKPGQGTGEQGTATLLGYLQIVQQLALTPGEAVYETRDQWNKFLGVLAPLANRDAFRQVQRIRAHLVASLSAMYPKDYLNTEWVGADGNMGNETWIERNELFPKPADVTYRWHVPSEDEIKLAKSLVEQEVEVVEQEIARLTAAKSTAAEKSVAEDAMDVDQRPASASAFDEQHAWIKALSQLSYLVHSTSTWVADDNGQGKKQSVQQRRFVKNNPVLETGPQVKVGTLRTRLVKLLETAWQVFQHAGDARTAEKGGAEILQVAHEEASDGKKESKEDKVAAPPADPNLSILVMLLSGTRTYLQTGRISSFSHSSAMRSRKALFRMPHGLAAGPAWDADDADAGRQLGPKWTSAKSLPRSLHIRRAHLIHLRRQKLNAHHLPIPERANELVDKLYPHCLSSYTGVRRTTQSTLLTVATPHISFRRDLLNYVIDTLTQLPQSKAMDKDERSARIRAGLNLLRSGTLVRAISNGPQYTWPFMRALLTVAKYQDEPQVISHAHYLTVAFIMNVSTMSFAPLVVEKAVDKVAELRWERKPAHVNGSEVTGSGPSEAVATATVTAVTETNLVAMEEAEVEKVEGKPVASSKGVINKPLTPKEKTAKLQAALDTMVRIYWTSSSTSGGQVVFPEEATMSESGGGDESDAMDVDQEERDVTNVTSMHWRLFGTMMSLVSALSIRHDVVLRPDLVSMLMAGWIHDHTHIRQGAEAILLALQARFKYRAGPNPAKSLVDVDDALADYLRHEKIDVANNGDSNNNNAPSFYIHEGSVGWLCFRDKINVYRMDPPAGPRHHAADTTAVDAFRKAFSKPEWANKLFHFMSLEQATQQGQVPAFHWNRSNQLRHLFAITGPARILDALLPLTIAKLQAPSDKASQLKCGLEFAAAVLRGSKHWPVAEAQRAWTELIPVWTAAMRASGPDTFRLYYMALRFVLGNRDPRMSQPLIQAVLEMARELEVQDLASSAVAGVDQSRLTGNERPETPSAAPSKASAFGVAKRLVYWRVLVESLGHRGVDDVAGWATGSMIKMLHHPYKLVRDTLATLVADSMHLVYRPLVRSTDAWIDLVNSSESGLAAQERIDQCMSLTKQTVDAIAQLPEVLRSTSKDDSAQAAKSIAVLALTAGNTARAHVGHTALLKFLPIVYKLVPSEDPEAVELASGAITTAAHFDLGSVNRVREFIAVLMDMIKTTEESHDRPASPKSTSAAASPTKSPSSSPSPSKNGSSWQIKLRVLRYIQVAFFRHLPILLANDREWIVDQVASLLLDPNVEVRTLAGVTLAGLVQCSGGVRDKDSNERNAVAARVRHHADRLLSRGPLPKRRHGQPLPEGFADAVRHRHAGVLALAALVRAHPYTVPAPEVPEALVKLASYAEDPVPIGPTVRSVFADFKRSHADSWHLDIMAFDEDQRSVMADMLVSPSYYA